MDNTTTPSETMKGHRFLPYESSKLGKTTSLANNRREGGMD
jgi:hypothetical protein